MHALTADQQWRKREDGTSIDMEISMFWPIFLYTNAALKYRLG